MPNPANKSEPRCTFRLLADAVDSEDAWQKAIERLETDMGKHTRDLNNLRSLLRDHDGHTVAELADRLL
jgi:hypothetical protein